MYKYLTLTSIVKPEKLARKQPIKSCTKRFTYKFWTCLKLLCKGQSVLAYFTRGTWC
jgi:hypothetical protein